MRVLSFIVLSFVIVACGGASDKASQPLSHEELQQILRKNLKLEEYFDELIKGEPELAFDDETKAQIRMDYSASNAIDLVVEKAKSTDYSSSDFSLRQVFKGGILLLSAFKADDVINTAISPLNSLDSELEDRLAIKIIQHYLKNYARSYEDIKYERYISEGTRDFLSGDDEDTSLTQPSPDSAQAAWEALFTRANQWNIQEGFRDRYGKTQSRRKLSWVRDENDESYSGEIMASIVDAHSALFSLEGKDEYDRPAFSRVILLWLIRPDQIPEEVEDLFEFQPELSWQEYFEFVESDWRLLFEYLYDDPVYGSPPVGGISIPMSEALQIAMKGCEQESRFNEDEGYIDFIPGLERFIEVQKGLIESLVESGEEIKDYMTDDYLTELAQAAVHSDCFAKEFPAHWQQNELADEVIRALDAEFPPNWEHSKKEGLTAAVLKAALLTKFEKREATYDDTKAYEVIYTPSDYNQPELPVYRIRALLRRLAEHDPDRASLGVGRQVQEISTACDEVTRNPDEDCFEDFMFLLEREWLPNALTYSVTRTGRASLTGRVIEVTDEGYEYHPLIEAYYRLAKDYFNAVVEFQREDDYLLSKHPFSLVSRKIAKLYPEIGFQLWTDLQRQLNNVSRHSIYSDLIQANSSAALLSAIARSKSDEATAEFEKIIEAATLMGRSNEAYEGGMAYYFHKPHDEAFEFILDYIRAQEVGRLVSWSSVADDLNDDSLILLDDLAEYINQVFYLRFDFSDTKEKLDLWAQQNWKDAPSFVDAINKDYPPIRQKLQRDD